ncbi:tetratricopeptide repeat protein [Streptomyces sp. NPDC003077]|uniref:tetratricopeptide repeat protein n=1 Tax=Streptomyces sp. NPDC003077 TaxID=3154443 RepID=UPI0033A8E7DC
MDTRAVRNELSGGTVYGNAVQAGSIGTVVFQEAAVPALVPGAPVPRTVPGATRLFVDREAVLAEVGALLDEAGGAPVVVVLCGPGGVGKTATALRLAAALGERFPEGQLYARLRGASADTAASPAEVLPRFLRDLGVHQNWIGGDQEAQESLFRSLTAGRRMLTVLDDAHSAAQVAPLLTPSAASLTLVTSRWNLGRLVMEHGARVVRIGPLATTDAVRLLARMGGTGRGVETVALRCGGVPLALCAVGARVAEHEHLDWEAVARDMAGDADPAVPDEPLRGVLDASYADLSDTAAVVYRRMAVRPWTHVTPGAAAAAAGVDEDAARSALGELARVRVVEDVTVPGADSARFRLHDVWRRHAEERALAEDGAAGVASAVRRVVLWYVRAAAAADACVLPGRWHLGPAYARLAGRPPAYPDGHRALDWLRGERENLAEAVRAAAEYGLDELVWQLCEAMWGLHLRLGFHEQWVRTHLLGVEAAARCADECPEAEGRMRTQLGFAYMGLGDHERAREAFAAAAEADRRAGHVRGEATAVESSGLLSLKQERWSEATGHFEAARDLARRVGDPRALALLEHHLGRALEGAGRHEAALGRLTRARELMRALPDPYNEARVLMSLGRTHLAAGDPARAEPLLTEAAVVMAAEGAVVQQADVAELRARAARMTGDRAAEIRFLREALGFHQATGAPGAVAVRGRLGELGEA